MAQSVYTPTEWKAFTSKTVQPRYIASVPASSYKQAPDYLFNGSYGTALIANYQTRGEAVLYIKTTSAFTITLSNVPDFVVGKRIIIKDQSGGTPNVTVQSHSPGSIPIDGLTSVNLTSPNGEWVVYCTGSAWTIQQTNFVAAAPPSGGYKWMRQDDCNNVSWQPLPSTTIGTLEGEVLLIKNGIVKPYDSIYEANDSAAVGSTIVLLKDLTLTTGIELAEGVSIDGNGKSITIGGSGDVDLFWTQSGETKIYNFKKIESTRTGTAARWLFAAFGGSKMFVDVDQIIVADGCVALSGNEGSKITINARSIDLGTYNASAGLNARKFFSNNGATISVNNAKITDDKVISTAYGFVSSVLYGGQELAEAGDTLRSVMEFINVELDVSRPISIVERMGELRMKNVKAKTIAKTAISMAGDPYVTNAYSLRHYNKAIFTDCEFTGGTESQGIYFTSLISLTADNSQGFDTNYQDVYWYGTNYLNTNTTNAIYNSIPRYTQKNYGQLIHNGPISGETFTHNQPIPLGATLVGGGSVTSVGLSVPSGLGVTGSPVTGSGTIAITTSLSGMLKGTGSGFSAATAGTDYVAGGVGTAGYIPKFASVGVIGNSIMQDLGTQIVINGGADAFKVLSTGSGVTQQLEQTSNNDVLLRFKRNGGNYWDSRYYYTGEALKFNYNDTPVLTLNTSGAATLAGALTVGSTTASTSTSTGSATFGGGIGVAGRAVIYSNSAYTGSITSLSADIGVGGTSHGFGYYNNGNTIELGVIAYGNLVGGFEGYDKERSFKLNGDNTNTFLQISSFLSTYTNNTSYWYQTIAGMSRILAWNRELRIGSSSNNVSIFSGTGTVAALTANSTKVDFPYTTASTSTSTGSATFGGGIGVAGRASLASAVVNTTLSVNGMAAGATTDTTVVINAGVLKKVLRSTQVDYAAWSGTDTWDGSAPSGTETHLYGYKVEGKTVTGWIRLEYSSGGATNTYVEVELSAFPTPAIPAYVGAGEMAFAANGFLATSSTSSPVTSRAWLYEASGALKLKILAASNGYRFAMATFTYQIP